MLSDIVSQENLELIRQEVGSFIEEIKEQCVKDIKPWKEFFAVFKPPQWNISSIEQRMVTNILHYRFNYIVLCLTIFCLRLLFSPIVLFSLVICLVFTIYLNFISKRPIIISGTPLTPKGKLIASAIFSLLFLIISGSLEQISWTLLISFGICSLHMIFRPRSVTATANKSYEDTKLSSLFKFDSKLDKSSDDVENPDVDELSGSSSNFVRRRSNPQN